MITLTKEDIIWLEQYLAELKYKEAAPIYHLLLTRKMEQDKKTNESEDN